jgi:hypothetical protein
MLHYFVELKCTSKAWKQLCQTTAVHILRSLINSHLYFGLLIRIWGEASHSAATRMAMEHHLSLSTRFIGKTFNVSLSVFAC